MKSITGFKTRSSPLLPFPSSHRRPTLSPWPTICPSPSLPPCRPAPYSPIPAATLGSGALHGDRRRGQATRRCRAGEPRRGCGARATGTGCSSCSARARDGLGTSAARRRRAAPHPAGSQAGGSRRKHSSKGNQDVTLRSVKLVFAIYEINEKFTTTQ